MRAFSVVVSTTLAAALLYYSVRGIDWAAVAQIVRGARPLPLAVAAVLGSLTLFLRAARWRILLNAEGAVSITTAFWATAAGYFGNNFLPARAGELVRTYMVSSRSTLSRTYVLATALSDRAADAVTLVAISAVVILSLPSQPGWMATATRPLAAFGLVAALGIAVVPLLESFLTRFIHWLPLSPAWRARLTTLTEHALRGVRAFHDLRRLSVFLVLTVAIWSLDAAGTVVAARALDLHLSIPAALLLMAGLGLGSALPSTPGYVGIYQFVAVTVLVPFGFSRTDAIAFILVAQAWSYVVVGIWGGIALLRHRAARRSA